MKNRKRSIVNQSIRNKKVKETPPGSSPGVLQIPKDALPPKIHVTTFNAEQLIEKDFDSSADLIYYYDSCSDCTHWIEMKGFGSLEVI